MGRRLTQINTDKAATSDLRLSVFIGGSHFSSF